jgi:hypothetical protein
LFLLLLEHSSFTYLTLSAVNLSFLPRNTKLLPSHFSNAGISTIHITA